jgi:hypothetical protein
VKKKRPHELEWDEDKQEMDTVDPSEIDDGMYSPF